MENHYLAINVGGTKVKYGLVNHSGDWLNVVIN